MSSKDLLGPLPPERTLPADSKARLKEELMAVISDETAIVQKSQGPRRRRRITVFAAAFLALASIGTAWALTRRPEQTTRIQCPGNSIIAAVSGDPVADCAAELRRQGIEPSEMVAYANENGGVVVVEAGSEIPPAGQPLDPEFRQDTAIIELEAALEDVTTGLAARCYTSSDAVPVVERELARLGLDWSVVITGDEADGDMSCALAAPEPEQGRVVVYSFDPGGVATGDEPWVALGTRLRQTLAAECLTLDQAAVIAEKIAVEVGADQGIVMTSTVDTEAACTRATVTVGGAVFVDLRGPADQ